MKPVHVTALPRGKSFPLPPRWLLGGAILAVAISVTPVKGQEDPLLATLRDAQQLILDGNLSAAETRLTATEDEYPQDSRVHNLLGVVRAQAGRFAAAERSFLRAIQLAPRFVGAHLNLARLYQQESATEPKWQASAVQLYQQLLALDPTHIEANYQVALLYHLRGEYRLSNEHLLRLPELDREQPQALALLCGNSAVLGDSAADETARRLLTNRNLVEADLLPVLPALRKSGREDLMLQLLQHLASSQLVSTATLEELAALYFQAGESSRARQILEDLAVRHPDLPRLLLKLAWIAYRSGDYQGSLSYLAHARDLEPVNSRIHLFFGLSCIELGLGLEAIRSLEKAISLDPDNAYYNYALGAAILQWREAREAIPYFEHYCRLKPGEPRGRAALAEALFLHKDYARAREEFESLLQHSETRVGAHYYLGVIAKTDLRVEDAEHHLRASLRLYPENPHALAEMGWVHTRQRDYPAAEEVLKHALELDADHYQANFNLLTLYSRTRDERLNAQKEVFERIKEKRWERLTDSLRNIEAVPPSLVPEFSNGPGSAANQD